MLFAGWLSWWRLHTTARLMFVAVCVYIHIHTTFRGYYCGFFARWHTRGQFDWWCSRSSRTFLVCLCFFCSRHLCVFNSALFRFRLHHREIIVDWNSALCGMRRKCERFRVGFQRAVTFVGSEMCFSRVPHLCAMLNNKLGTHKEALIEQTTHASQQPLFGQIALPVLPSELACILRCNGAMRMHAYFMWGQPASQRLQMTQSNLCEQRARCVCCRVYWLTWSLHIERVHLGEGASSHRNAAVYYLGIPISLHTIDYRVLFVSEHVQMSIHEISIVYFQIIAANNFWFFWEMNLLQWFK